MNCAMTAFAAGQKSDRSVRSRQTHPTASPETKHPGYCHKGMRQLAFIERPSACHKEDQWPRAQLWCSMEPIVTSHPQCLGKTPRGSMLSLVGSRQRGRTVSAQCKRRSCKTSPPRIAVTVCVSAPCWTACALLNRIPFWTRTACRWKVLYLRQHMLLCIYFLHVATNATG